MPELLQPHVVDIGTSEAMWPTKGVIVEFFAGLDGYSFAYGKLLMYFYGKGLFMTARLIVYFDEESDLIRVLQLLKDSGLEKLSFYTQTTEKNFVEPEKRDWSLAGSVDLGDKLASISNLRDFAYNDGCTITVNVKDFSGISEIKVRSIRG